MRPEWQRIGAGKTGPSMSCRSSNTSCIHTEVESFDDALKLLATRQRVQAKADSPPTWRQQLNAHRARKKSLRGHALVIGQPDGPSEFEQHVVARVVAAIQSLKLGVEEMSVISAMGVKFPALNPKTLTAIIVSLCHLINQDVPEFNVQRTPVRKPPRLCVNCAAELEKNELEYCRHCNPETQSLRIASQLRTEHYAQLGALARGTKQLEKLIKQTSKVIGHGDDQGYGGHSGKITGDLETGGREKDLIIGGETPHQPGTGGTGNAES
jgi:hypothetical protein